MESERVLKKVIFSIMADNMELFKQVQDNLSFRKCLFDMVFNVTYNTDGESYKSMINRYNLSSEIDKNLQ